MDFATSSNAEIQDNPKGFMRKNVIHVERKDCESRSTEEEHDLTLVYMDIWFGVLVLKDCSTAKMNNTEIGISDNICITQWKCLQDLGGEKEEGRERKWNM